MIAEVGASHFAHPWAAFGAFIAQHDDVAGLDLSGEDRLETLFFGFENPCGAGDFAVFYAGELCDCAAWCQVAAQDR